MSLHQVYCGSCLFCYSTFIDFNAFKKDNEKVLFGFTEQRAVSGVLPMKCASLAGSNTRALGPSSGNLDSTADSNVSFEEDMLTATSHTRIYPSLH